MDRLENKIKKRWKYFLKAWAYSFQSPIFYTIHRKPIATLNPQTSDPQEEKLPGSPWEWTGEPTVYAPTCRCISIHMLLCPGFLPKSERLDKVRNRASAPRHILSETTCLSLFFFFFFPVNKERHQLVCTRETLLNVIFCQGSKMTEPEPNFYL